MKKSTRLLSVLGFAAAITFTACTTQDPLSVEQYSNNQPSTTPLIKKAEYKTGEHDSISYSIGFANGNLRTKKVLLKWNKAADASFMCYKIYQEGNLVKTINNSSATELLIDQNSGSAAKYKVVVINNTGISQQDTLTLRTSQNDGPGNVAYYVSQDEKSAKLYWHSNCEAASAYDVYKKKSGDSEYGTPTRTTDTTITIGSLDPGASYDFKIKSRSAYETLSDSTFKSFSAVSSLAKPVNFYLSQPERTEFVKLKWSDMSTGEDKILIYRSTQSLTGPYNQPTVLSGSNLSNYIDKNVIGGITYYYKIRALKSATNTAPSDTTAPTFGQISIDQVVTDSICGFDTKAATELATKFEMSGNKPWVTSLVDPYFGTGCIKSGDIQPGQKSIIQKKLTVKHAGNISFKYRVSTRSNYDGLAVYVNGELKWTATGWHKWSSMSINLPPNDDGSEKNYKVEWVYFRGATSGANEDAVFLDNIEVNNN